MKYKSKNNLGRTIKELAVVALITGWTFISSGNGTNMSTELWTKYNMEEIMEIPLPNKSASEKIKYLTPKERRKLLAYAFKEVDLPSYIDKNYVNATIKTESHWNAYAVSNVGAKGLMQIMEQTWSDYDSTNYKENVFKPEKNILVGVKHLKQIDEDLKKNCSEYSNWSDKEKQDIVSAGYYNGTKNLKRNNWDIKKVSRKTKNHVKKMRGILGN